MARWGLHVGVFSAAYSAVHAAYPLPVQTILDQLVGPDESPMGQPVQHMGHTSGADFDEALVAQMNAIFAHVGLKLVREG